MENDLSGVTELLVNIVERWVSYYTNLLMVGRGKKGVRLYLNTHLVNRIMMNNGESPKPINDENAK